jgi:signal transduction histidine kinase
MITPGSLTDRPRIQRLLVAILTVLVAAAARIAFESWLDDRVTLITFYPAVMLSAWWAGLAAGLAATLGSAVTAAYLWLEPDNPADIFTLALFIAVGAAISVLNESLHRGRGRERAAREAAERALGSERVAKTEAERANHLKDRVLATVSHEVRTPLTAILLWSDMLRKEILPEAKRQEAGEAIYANARRQGRLIDDLLDTARIVAGTLHLDLTAVNLEDVIQGAIEVVRPSADTKQVHIAVDMEPAIGPVCGDPSRLQQVIWNVLMNGIKFTPPGGAIYVRARRVDQTAEILVRDTGKGIAPAQLSRIFEPFQQIGASDSRRGGLGLGLSIVKQLVEAHGGGVSASSEGPGRGSTVSIRLPLAVAEPVVPSMPVEYQSRDR